MPANPASRSTPIRRGAGCGPGCRCVAHFTIAASPTIDGLVGLVDADRPLSRRGVLGPGPHGEAPPDATSRPPRTADAGSLLRHRLPGGPGATARRHRTPSGQRRHRRDTLSRAPAREFEGIQHVPVVGHVDVSHPTTDVPVCHAHLLDDVGTRPAGRRVPGSPAPISASRARNAVSASSRSTASISSASANRVGVQSDAEPEFVDALGVFVLVPEQRQHDQRLAEVQRLGDGVVAAVRDHQVDLGNHLGLRQHLRRRPCCPANVIRSACGPLLTMNRCRVVPSTSTRRCMSATSAPPSEPSER